RNVPDDVLDLLASNEGVLMVDYLPAYVSREVWEWEAARRGERARFESLHLGDPEGREAAMEAWTQAHPAPHATLAQVADHLDHVKQRIGAEHLGLGSDFDGMPVAPDGLSDVADVPDLLVELLRRGWTDQEVAGVAGGNVLRVMRAVEAESARQASKPASNVRITPVLAEPD
ncbi:MAG: membrane dipeptidase, partial [Myxococcales bacterium]|nr:membrane dipeptidase [Myxococcales bacterium]